MNETTELRDRVMQELSGEKNPHRQNIALLSYELLSTVDMQMAAHIGFNGSILNEIHKRLSPDGGQNPIDMNGMDPKLARYVRGATVFIEVPQSKRLEQVHQSFQIDCLVGMFVPSIRMRTHDGYVEFNVHTGHDNIDFSHVTITRTYADAVGTPYHKREIQTFPTPSHPTDKTNELKITEYAGFDHHITMAYEAVGITGDLQLVDGQSVMMSPGPYGNYDSKTASIKWKYPKPGYSTPTVLDDPHSLILEQSGGIRFSFLKQTNLYEEVRFLLQTNSDIRLSK